jgi:hypothetical protein
MNKLFHHPFFIRLLHWEYWPFHMVYGPIYFYWFWLCLRARSFFFFNTANPTIKNGGFLMESKKEIYDLIPRQYYPATLFFRAGSSPDAAVQKIAEQGLKYPLIGKPDIGMKALMVKKLESETDLKEYCRGLQVDFLIQECIPYPNEIGIFYFRYPWEKKGQISGVVRKEFLSVTGDGFSTITELIKKHDRALLQLKALQKTYGEKLNTVLESGELFILVPYGSHFRGSKFTDESYLADDRLVALIDSICQQVNGYFYGRIDLRFASWEDLKQGKNFSIIEMNGAGSEPTHMYDPKHSLLFAWKEIIRHWKILFRISLQNHHPVSHPFLSFSKGMEMFRQHNEYVKLIDGK